MNDTIKIGSWITLNHISIVEIIADAGFDWLCVDMEHTVIDYLDAEKLILAIQSKGLEAFVRVGENNTRIIKRVLDAGADGIIVPMVSTSEEVKKATDAFYYPPLGKRGVGLSRAQNYGLDNGFFDYRNEKANDLKLIVQIEHIDAIRNLDAILANDLIDGTFIGPFDLSGSMGKPGQYDEPDVLEALKIYTDKAKASNKLMGFHVIEPEPERLSKKIEEGYNFIAYSLDTLFLGAKTREAMADFTNKKND